MRQSSENMLIYETYKKVLGYENVLNPNDGNRYQYSVDEYTHNGQMQSIYADIYKEKKVTDVKPRRGEDGYGSTDMYSLVGTDFSALKIYKYVDDTSVLVTDEKLIDSIGKEILELYNNQK